MRKLLNTPARFGLLSMGLHWLMLLLLVGAFACISLSDSFAENSSTAILLKTSHFTLGLTVFALVWVRLIAKLVSPAPVIEPPIAVWQDRTSKVVQALLYGLMTRFFGRVRYRWQWPQARQALRASLPFAMMALLYGVNERIDMVMLERLHSPAEAGYYAGAYRWVDAVMMYAWTVLPLFFARFAAVPTDAGAQRALLWFGQRVLTLPLLFVVAFVLFRGEVLFWQFGHSTPAELARMTLCLKILFLNVLVHAFFAIYSTLLTSTAHEKAVSAAVAASVVLNVGLNLVLLPRYGAVAAAGNTLVCAAGVSGTYLVLVARRTGVALPWGLLARLLLAFGLLCGGWYGLRVAPLALPWWLETAAMGAAFGGLVLLLGLVRPQELRTVLKRG